MIIRPTYSFFSAGKNCLVVPQRYIFSQTFHFFRSVTFFYVTTTGARCGDGGGGMMVFSFQFVSQKITKQNRPNRET